MKKPLFLGFNWKLNPVSLEETQNLIEHYTKLNPADNLNICIFPPTIYLHQVSEVSVINPTLSFGPQTISSFEIGAYTAEVSAVQAKDLGSSCALIGHSETRKINSLQDNDINIKVKLALQNNLIPVLCIGYSSDENQTGIDYKELRTQLETGLEGTQEYLENTLAHSTKTQNPFKLIIAYEPVWAIGTGKIATKEQVIEVLDFIQGVLKKIYDQDITTQIGLLYGGSVDDSNAGELIEISNLNGFLVGGASLKPEKLAKIVNIINTKA